MVRNKPTFEIVVCHFDKDKREKPKELVQRCCGEIATICRQLGLTTQLLVSATRRDDAIRLCEYYYVDAIMGIYIIRERFWDALAALVNVHRKNTGDKKFRKCMLTQLEVYPELKASFEKFLATILADMKMRNTTTHETLPFLAVTPTNNFCPYEIDSVLEWRDPDSTGGKEIYATIRKTLRSFVRQQAKRIQAIEKQALDVVKLCNEARHKKSW